MKDEIIQFLKENIIGKNLFTDDVVYQLDNGKLEGVYSDKIVFSDLAKTENGQKLHKGDRCQRLYRNECVSL